MTTPPQQPVNPAQPGPQGQPGPAQPGPGQPGPWGPGQPPQYLPDYQGRAYPTQGYAVPGQGYGMPGQPPYPYRVPPPVTPAGQPLAEFGDRLVAFIIDRLIIGAISMVIILPIMLLFFGTWFPTFIDQLPETPTDGSDSVVVPTFDFVDFFLPFCGLYLLAFGLTFVAAYIYDVEMMYRSGQTIGKKVAKVQVVPLDPTATLTRGMAFKRYLASYVAGAIVPFFNYLDGFWQLWDKPYRQCLHDKFAATTVVTLKTRA